MDKTLILNNLTELLELTDDLESFTLIALLTIEILREPDVRTSFDGRRAQATLMRFILQRDLHIRTSSAAR
jgi:hypothetical protein